MTDYMCTPSYDGLTITYHADAAQMELIAHDPEITKQIIKNIVSYGLQTYLNRLTEIGKPTVSLDGCVFTVFLPCIIDGNKKPIFASEHKGEAMKARGYDFHAVIDRKDVFINSSTLTDDKKKAIFDKYGLKTFIEQTGDKHLVLYDPKMFTVVKGIKAYLSYIGPVENTNVVLPYNCSSMFMMFANSNIKKIDFTGCDLSEIVTMESAFTGSQVTLVGFGEQNMERLMTLERCFYFCRKLQTVFMCYTKMPNVKSTSSCFKNCQKLYDVDIGTVDMPKLEDTYHMFQNCSSLTRAEFPAWNNCLKDSSDMFSYCSELVLVSMINVKFQKTDCTGMFKGCKKLRAFLPGEVNIKECTTTSMFSNCTNIQAEQKTTEAKMVLLNMKQLLLNAMKKQAEARETESELKADVIEQETSSSMAGKDNVQTKEENKVAGEREGTIKEMTAADIPDDKKKKLALAKKKGYDVYCVIKGQDVFINSNEWSQEKDDKLFLKYGVRFSRERGVYNPDVQIIQSFTD